MTTKSRSRMKSAAMPEEELRRNLTLGSSVREGVVSLALVIIKKKSDGRI